MALTGSGRDAPDYRMAVATHLAEALDGWIYTEGTGELCDADGWRHDLGSFGAEAQADAPWQPWQKRRPRI